MFCRRQPVLSLLTIAAACCLLLAADKPELADGDVKPFVDRRVEEWQPTADERRFDEDRFGHERHRGGEARPGERAADFPVHP
jgi:hypothetical protein